VSQRLTQLPQLNSAELRTEWRRLFRSSPPSLSRDLLVRALAYRLQEQAEGGLPKSVTRKLATLSAELQKGGQISVEAGPQIKPGARLVREWHGRTHVVKVTEEGFSYAGATYPSLTRIAHVITGTHWSGPRFFGLTRKVARQADEAARLSPAAPKRLVHKAPAEVNHG
jgi:hypothetical protein